MPDDTYWSVALYQANTVNYYVKNDMEYKNSQLNISIVKEVDFNSTSEQIASPDSKGFMLIRVLIADRDSGNQKAIYDYLNSLVLAQ